MPENQHSLFRQFPIANHVTINDESLPVPYHVYDGTGLLIGGTGDAVAVQSLIANENLSLIKTTGGKALIAIWVMDFADASLNAHLELQFSIFVSRTELPPVDDHPFALLKLLITDPAPRMLCHDLWNDTSNVVNYNTQLLGLPAKLCHGYIERDTSQHTKKFEFTDAAAGEMMITGSVSERSNPQFSTISSLFGYMGFINMLRLARTDVLSVQVVNPAGNVIPHNADAQTYSAADKIVVQQYDPETDTIDILRSPYSDIQFQPQFLEHFIGMKFVYLNPHNIALLPKA